MWLHEHPRRARMPETDVSATHVEEGRPSLGRLGPGRLDSGRNGQVRVRKNKRTYRYRLHQARIAWAPSPVRRVLRHGFFRVGVVVVLGIGASLTWSARVAALDEQRAQWGELTSVLVVLDDVESGAPINEAVELRQLPLATVPSGAVRTVAPDARAKAALYVGEVLLAERITGTDPLGPPPGTVALTLSTVATAPVLSRGDLIDVWAVDTANQSSRRIAHAVVVVFLASDEITIAIPEASVAETTAAALRPIVVTLVG